MPLKIFALLLTFIVAACGRDPEATAPDRKAIIIRNKNDYLGDRGVFFKRLEFIQIEKNLERLSCMLSVDTGISACPVPASPAEAEALAAALQAAYEASFQDEAVSNSTRTAAIVRHSTVRELENLRRSPAFQGVYSHGLPSNSSRSRREAYRTESASCARLSTAGSSASMTLPNIKVSEKAQALEPRKFHKVI